MQLERLKNLKKSLQIIKRKNAKEIKKAKNEVRRKNYANQNR